MSGCCSPSREPDASAGVGGLEALPGPASHLDHRELIEIPGGAARVGSAEPDFPEEWPVREVVLTSYRIASCAVTNAEYAGFVAATGYRTDAETFGSSFVFAGLLPDDFPPTRGVAAAPWWREVLGADWAHPEGPATSVTGREDHPVVHVSRRDAEAYAAWAGARLPTEDEWEHASRGGLADQPFPWGEELEPDGEHRMNVWQGTFPTINTAADGWSATCPVDTFAPNGYGLHNTTGNVWEWCAGPWSADVRDGVSRGGSYLCHASYCRRYRVSARQQHSADSSAGNLGFRLASG